ncbi:uncharacterized protein TNCV_3786801 [Trichonephila clavipes]|nr:uncharacterized protein TNCV_3786801 [Trichonephila clavipes]
MSKYLNSMTTPKTTLLRSSFDFIKDLEERTTGEPQRSVATCHCDSKVLGAVVAKWYRYRTVACLVTSSSPVPLKTHRVGQRCTLDLSRAEVSSRWCGS